jgi:hypothetical protein
MAVYGPGCHPQNIIWTEAKLRFIYYFVGDRSVHELPFGPKHVVINPTTIRSRPPRPLRSDSAFLLKEKRRT